MELYKFKPQQYVDVLPDLPIEWLRGQIKEKQDVINAQKEELNKSAENWLKLNYGKFGKDTYDEVNKEYQAKLQKMSEDILTKQDIPGVAESFSTFVRQAAFDPRIKDLNKEYAAYQQYQENLQKPEYAGAVDLTDLGKQIGPEWDVNKAISYYPLVKYEDSMAPYVQTAEKFKPNKDYTTGEWVFTNPITNETYRSFSKETVEEVSRQRLQNYFEDLYYTWDKDARSRHNKLTATNKDLSLFDASGKFLDENVGREIFRNLYKPYLNIAYTQKDKTENIQNLGGGSGTKPSTPTPPPPPQGKGYDETNADYGFGVLGKRLSTGENISDYDEAMGNMQDYQDQISQLDKQRSNLYQQAEAAYRTGNQTLGDNLFAQANELAKKQNNLQTDLTQWVSYQKAIEGDLYNKASDPKLIQAADKEYTQYAISHLIGNENIPGMFSDQQRIKDWELAKQSSKGLKEYIRKYNIAASSINSESINDFLKNGAEWSKIKTDITTNYLGKDSIEAKKIEKWNQYINYLTKGTSYIPRSEEEIKGIDNIVLSLITSGKKPRELLSDKEVRDFPKLQKALLQLQQENGSFNTKGVSTEILLDEEDGGVLILHGLNIDGSKGKDVPNSIEFDITDTPSLLSIVNRIDPERAVRNTYFIQAAQSLKNNNNKKGSFIMGRYGNNTENVSFERIPIGDGKFAFKDEKGITHGSLLQLIEARIVESGQIDAAFQAVDAYYANEMNKKALAGDKKGFEQVQREYQIYDNKRRQELGKDKEWRKNPKTPLR